MTTFLRRLGTALAGLVGFVAMSVVAGLLATAAVTPAIALTGIAATNTIGLFENLPDYLRIDPLSQRTNIYANNKDGSAFLLATFYEQNRVEVGADAVSANIRNAAIAAEDPRFYSHGGIDLQGTARALVNNLSRKNLQGGSTITQQYVKNVLIENAQRNSKTPEEAKAAYLAATAVSEARKLREMRLAIGLEKKYSKDQILLGYLNIALFGGTVYGIEAAANYYFGTTAANATLPQAASLLAMVNNPSNLRIDQPDNTLNGAADGYRLNAQRRNYILDNMLRERMITQKERDDAVATPVQPVITPPKIGCMSAGGSGYFCDYVLNIFRNTDLLGPDQATRLRELKRGGFDVYTTLDVELQVAAELAVNDNVPQVSDALDVGAVAVGVQPGTGRILFMAQNKTYADDPAVATGPQFSAVNFNTDQNYGGSTGMQPGSTFKVFTLMEWLKEGYGLNQTVDARLRTNGWGPFRDSCAPNGSVIPRPVDWSPKNDEGGNGGIWTALFNTVNSENTGFVAMAKKLDLCAIRQTAEAFGVQRADGIPLDQGPSFVLGTNEIAPLRMAGAFAGIAANGMVCAPIAIDRIVGPDGKERPVPKADCQQRADPAVVATAASALAQVITSGTARSSRIGDGIPVIGKTGTTDNNEATWMSGASTKLATVVGVFNVNGHVDLRTVYLNGVKAADIRHRIWPRIMKIANAKFGGDAFPAPDPRLVRGKTAVVPDVRGLSVDQAKAKLEGAGFFLQDGGPQDSNYPAGTVSGTDPSGEVSVGALIKVFTSNGSGRTVPNVTGLAPPDAAAQLTAAGFSNLSARCQASPGAPAVGVVSGQEPAANSAGKPDTPIALTVAKPTCP